MRKRKPRIFWLAVSPGLTHMIREVESVLVSVDEFGERHEMRHPYPTASEAYEVFKEKEK